MAEETANINVFKSIMEQIDTVNGYDIQIGDEYHKVNSLSELTIFALNIMLVFEGVKLVYKDFKFIEANKHLIDFIENLCEGIVVMQNKSGPLVMLKKNKTLVEKLLYEMDGDPSLGLANIVGYGFVNDEWYSENNRYIISYMAFGNKKNIFSLYAFVCPIEKYNNKIRNKILEDSRSFENVLKNYGYTVHITISIQKEGCKIQQNCEKMVLNMMLA